MKATLMPDPHPLDALAAYISRVRGEKKLSLPEIKRRGGPSLAWVNAIENRTTIDTPKPATLRKLAHALGVSEAEVFAAAGLVVDGGQAEALKHNNEARLRQLHELPILNNSLGIMSDDGSVTPITNGQASGNHGAGGPRGVEFVRLPLYGPAAAGSPPSWSLDDSQETIPVPRFVLTESGAQAVFKVSGDSMSAERIADGEHVLVRPYAGHERPQPGDIVIVQSEGGYACKMYQKNLLGAYLESRYAGRDPEPWKPAEDAMIVGLVLGGIWYDTRKRR